MRIVKVVLAFIIICILAGVGFIYLVPQRAASFFFDLERQRAGLARKEINIPNGLHYAYLEGGQGEPLILLHGFGGDKDNFTRAARFLTPHYRVIIPDHIGFGESSHPHDADYSAGAQATRIRSLVQALGITNVNLGGNSMGGMISMMYASLYHNEVKTLWLINPGGVGSAPKSELMEIITKGGKNPIMARNEEEFANLFSFVMSDPPFIPGPILNVLARERIRNYDLEKHIFEEIIKDVMTKTVEKRVTRLKTPALIVWGDKDRVVNPAGAEILHKLMSQSEVIIMKGLGHMPMLEQPGRTAKDYIKFCEGLVKTKSTN